MELGGSCGNDVTTSWALRLKSEKRWACEATLSHPGERVALHFPFVTGKQLWQLTVLPAERPNSQTVSQRRKTEQAKLHVFFFSLKGNYRSHSISVTLGQDPIPARGKQNSKNITFLVVEDFSATKIWTTRVKICMWCHGFWPCDSLADRQKKKRKEKQSSHMRATAIT